MWQSNLIDTALGRTPPDLYLQGGTVVNVYSGEIYPADIAVKDGRIAYVGKDLGGAQPAGCTVIDARGCNLLPGFIEPHGHPAQFHDTVEYTRAASQNGITAVVSDSYKLLKALGPRKFACYIEEIKKSTPVKVYWFLRIFAEYYLSSGEPLVSPEEMQELVNLPQVLSIGETTRWPEILQKEGFPLEAIRMIRAAGKRPDGHTAGATGKKLAALAAAGISGCHESVTAEEVMERLRNGMYVTLRHSSQRPDLDNFLSILRDKKADLSRFMLTTDGSSPAFPHQDWNVAALAERLIEKGIDPLTAIRMITLNPAIYYRIDHQIGSLAPGRAADIVVTEGFNLSRPRMVLIDGKVVYNREATAAENKAHFKSSPLAGTSKTYFAYDWRVTPDLFAVPALEGKKDGKEEKEEEKEEIEEEKEEKRKKRGKRGKRITELKINKESGTVRFPVIEMVNAVITRRLDMTLPVTNGAVTPGCSSAGLLKIALLDMKKRRAGTGFIKGLAENIEGLASSLCCALGVIIVFGNNDEAIALAANRVLQLGGGIAVAESGRILWEIKLELPGELTVLPFEEVRRLAGELEETVCRRGYSWGDFFHTMTFLPGDFLPHLRINTEGIFDVLKRKIIYPSVAWPK